MNNTNGRNMNTGKMISSLGCPEFVSVLASKEPVPGGGGAAALCGAVGTALSGMVASLTLGKKKYAAVQDEIEKLNRETVFLREKLLGLIDADAECFRPLADAYRLPADTDEEKAHKREVMEQCSKEACSVPLEIMKCCARGIEISSVMAEKGSVLALSDAGCSAVILKSAMFAASMNVFINTKSIEDAAFAENTNSYVNDMLEKYGALADYVFETVKSSMTDRN